MRRGTHHGWNGWFGRQNQDACSRLSRGGNPFATRAKDWLGEHSAAGRQFSAYGVDVANIDSCRECVVRVTKDIGPIDILVNNAGKTKDTTFKR
jgi:acetoacetyl-CoA reductase